MSKTIPEFIIKAPYEPGCYLYKNDKNKVIYIGKAKNINKRVRQYFQNFSRLDPKIQLMVKNITNVEFITVENEVEALVLEANLIKKYQPKYNKGFKDDKRYVWIRIDKKESFPRIIFTRDQKYKNTDYFGPFPSKPLVSKLLKRLRYIFPYRNCKRKLI